MGKTLCLLFCNHPKSAVFFRLNMAFLRAKVATFFNLKNTADFGWLRIACCVG